jgi:hypothetical protein
MKGYICRSKNSNQICIACLFGERIFNKPEIDESGRFVHIPGWFSSMNIRTFKKKYGFNIKPGSWQYINISIN